MSVWEEYRIFEYQYLFIVSIIRIRITQFFRLRSASALLEFCHNMDNHNSCPMSMQIHCVRFGHRNGFLRRFSSIFNRMNNARLFENYFPHKYSICEFWNACIVSRNPCIVCLEKLFHEFVRCMQICKAPTFREHKKLIKAHRSIITRYQLPANNDERYMRGT